LDRQPTTTKPLLSPRRRRGAAIQIIGGGLLLLVLPVVLGQSPVAEGFATLAPVGWFMLVGGGVLMWSLRDKAPSPRRVQVAPVAGKNSRHAAPMVDAPPLVNRMSVDIELGLDLDPVDPHAMDSTRVVRPQAWDKGLIEGMAWRRFESVVETLFQQAGFETGLQSHGGQEGVDIWLYSRSRTGGPVSLVQCKHGYGERVHPERLRALRAAMEARQIQRGQFATTATFTPEAAAFARKNGIHLLDAEGLLALIAKRTPEQQAALMALAVG
jgi:restriction system protein